ncbi:DUF2262 domain-containing protein [Campylobacter lari]|uniref:DUF2262 domain-containing protein n=1 Tax=Campylobacter lari TaxID=201 RepID=UPI00057E38AE|nr:DUF2262 domain-containing protein [Campylobacter lari]AJD06605.1 hypothetical protein (DUF2262 domain) [Campylobacter lari RM16712]MCR6542247.1 DUF2262 domain-containing protein [Campylobacter lari]MCV3385435.1 DUF2262 domain-containing protein [Campylobacter lari]MCV3501588.1 DUF2262 domain-containing protein [Campylobacter lari]
MAVKNKVFEVATVFGEGSVAATYYDDKFYRILLPDVIAYKNLENNEIIENKILINKIDSDTTYYHQTFKEKTIMKLKVKEINNKTFEFIDVIENNYKDEELQNILNSYLEPIYCKDEVLGKFTLNKSLNIFEKDFSWINNITVLIHFNNDNKQQTYIKTARKIIENRNELDKKVKEYAYGQLAGKLNDKKLSKEEFINSLSFESIDISNDTIEFYIDDRGLFGWHVIIVESSFNLDLKKSYLAG